MSALSQQTVSALSQQFVSAISQQTVSALYQQDSDLWCLECARDKAANDPIHTQAPQHAAEYTLVSLVSGTRCHWDTCNWDAGMLGHRDTGTLGH